MEFFQWLREDPRHETAWENCLKFWRRFDPRSGSEILFFVSQRRKPRSDRRSPVRPRQKEH